MNGFFTEKELRPTEPQCLRCGLDRKCESPRMKPYGKGKKKIMVIGEAPGKNEDEQGRQFIGKAGKTLRKFFSDNGIDMDRDCITLNAVNCHPKNKEGNNRTPTPKEVEWCKPLVTKAIKRHRPKLILNMGKVALDSFIHGKWKKKVGELSQWLGFVIPDRDLKTWVCNLYHPSYLNRMDKQSLNTTFNNMLENALPYAKKKFPAFTDERKLVKILHEPNRITEFLGGVYKKGIIAFDYETTGLKPQADGHRIFCCSMATGPDSVFVFPVDETDMNVMGALKLVLASKKVKKIAHNIAFEDTWTKVILKENVRGWVWDTMLASHIIDNRGKITSLKFQTYINFGVADYDSDVEHFLKSEGTNGFNRLHGVMTEKDTREVMTYCGLDSLYTYHLYEKQVKITPAKAMRLFMDGAKVLAKIQRNGICIDEKFQARKRKNIDSNINDLTESLMKRKEVKLWQKHYGDKFKLGSSTQLGHLLKNMLKVDTGKKTATGKVSTDQEALEKMSKKGMAWLNNLLKLKKQKKIIATYIDGVSKEIVDGRIHPFFHLNRARSLRSSASDPNTQNFPERDKEANRLVKGAIIPGPGNRIMEADYGSIEVCVSACVHEDPVMIDYIHDPSSDMHRDMAQELFFIDDEKMVSKDARFIAKNNFVFAEFYGDWYESCAKGLWESMKAMDVMVGDDMLRRHLKRNKINDLEAFIRHVKKIEDYLWKSKFKVYSKWKKKHLANYERKGYFDIVTGFRCSGHMTRNQIFNRPIQGPAFHCLLWSLSRMQKHIEAKGMKSKIINEIHDSVVGDVHPDEFNSFCNILVDIMTVRIREKWKWIIVPLKVNIEATEINGSWDTKKLIELN